LSWLRSESADPSLTCAEVASLSLASLTAVPAGPNEKLFLRVRIPRDPQPETPLWGWFVEHVATGAKVAVVAVDEAWRTVAVPIASPGEYRIRTHTHYPDTAVCGAELRATATAP